MITKEQFLNAYGAYPPNKAQIFFYKYFGNTKDRSDKWLADIIIIFWVVLVFLGIFAAAFQWIQSLKVITFTFVFTFFPFWIFALVMIITNRFRLRRVRKKLGLSWSQYNFYADMYL